jgi:DNA polymerase-3 subunit gamma/tau
MLNLARRLRSQTFEQVIGQPIVVRILKNSLYKNYFFPLYLFAGMRGCGKTTTARIFAMAINCQSLVKFQSNPRENIVPCLECVSCLAALNGNHPDIIEIDAASHTGVDNVRQIIENSTYMSLMGTKKVYIIDEAHMLSKAAFNAFLKVLEEPSSSVVFILATTEHAKIIDTVRSRALQLFFRPVSINVIKNYLVDVALQESINIQDAALDMIARQSEGSVRDALNMLEQVRFIASTITVDHLQAIFGQIAQADLDKILTQLLSKNIEQLVSFFKSDIWKRVLPDSFFKQLLLHVRSLAIVNETRQNQYINLLSYLCKNEYVFLKAVDQRICLESILLSYSSVYTNSIVSNVDDAKLSNEITVIQERVNNFSNQGDWDSIISNMRAFVDPIVSTFFAHAIPESLAGKTVFRLPKNYVMFEDIVWQHEDSWAKFLSHFGDITFEFSLASNLNDEPIKSSNNFVQNFSKQKNVNINNKEQIVEPQGPISQKLMDLFPGVVTISKK